MSRQRMNRTFLWFSALAWGVGLGAKLFDLLVLASAWGASPPSSLALYPYGVHWPINPGSFFQPLSGLLLVGGLGTLIAGWKTHGSDRAWLATPRYCFHNDLDRYADDFLANDQRALCDLERKNSAERGRTDTTRAPLDYRGFLPSSRYSGGLCLRSPINQHPLPRRRSAFVNRAQKFAVKAAQS
jgi:hypothetical protein